VVEQEQELEFLLEEKDWILPVAEVEESYV
jgi:hypothetical protein